MSKVFSWRGIWLGIIGAEPVEYWRQLHEQLPSSAEHSCLLVTPTFCLLLCLPSPVSKTHTRTNILILLESFHTSLKLRIHAPVTHGKKLQIKRTIVVHVAACVSAWVHLEQQFEACCVELSLLPVVVSIAQELAPLQSPSSVPLVWGSAHAHHFSGNLV